MKYFGTVILSLVLISISTFHIPTLVLAHTSRAYIDPGTGSFTIQVVIGVIFGTAYTLRSYGSRFISNIRGRFSRKNEQED